MIHINMGSIALSGLFALGGSLVASPALADDQTVSAGAPDVSIHASGCPLWNLGGDWPLAFDPGISTGNWGLDLAATSLPPRMKLQQTGTQLRGSITFPEVLSQAPLASGSVIGTVSGDTFEVIATWRYTKASNWNFERTMIYDGQITPDGVVSGIFYDKIQGPDHATNWHSERIATCKSDAARILDSRKDHHDVLAAQGTQPAIGFGRVRPRDTTIPPPPICDVARSARARNSPAAPALEQRCLASGDSLTPPPPPPPPPSPQPPPGAAPDLDSLVAIGAVIAGQDPAVAEARNAEAGAFYQLGFDIASGLFGDPALGSAGKTAMDPASDSIRNSLSAAGQRGFDASAALHLARDYQH